MTSTNPGETIVVNVKAVDGTMHPRHFTPSAPIFCPTCANQLDFDIDNFLLRVSWNKLIETVMNSLSCGRLSTELAVKEYLRFLELKCVEDDFMCYELSPSPLIDRVWQAHIVDTVAYEWTCKDLYAIHHVGPEPFRFIHRKPENIYRLEQTKALYKQYFRSTPDERFWSESLDTFLHGEDWTVFKIDSGLADQLRLVCAGKQLEPGRTLKESHIGDGSVVQIVHRFRGC